MNRASTYFESLGLIEKELVGKYLSPLKVITLSMYSDKWRDALEEVGKNSDAWRLNIAINSKADTDDQGENSRITVLAVDSGGENPIEINFMNPNGRDNVETDTKKTPGMENRYRKSMIINSSNYQILDKRFMFVLRLLTRLSPGYKDVVIGMDNDAPGLAIRLMHVLVNKKCESLKLYGDKIVDGKLLNMILPKIMPAEILKFDVKTDEIFNIARICDDDDRKVLFRKGGDWLTVDKMNLIPSKVISLRMEDDDFKADRLNEFFRRWKEGANPNLEFMSVKVNDGRFKKTAILDGLDARPWDPETREEKFPSVEYRKPFECFTWQNVGRELKDVDIFRHDGIIGTISYLEQPQVSRTVEFRVWKNPFPKANVLLPRYRERLPIVEQYLEGVPLKIRNKFRKNIQNEHTFFWDAFKLYYWQSCKPEEEEKYRIHFNHFLERNYLVKVINSD